MKAKRTIPAGEGVVSKTKLYAPRQGTTAPRSLEQGSHGVSASGTLTFSARWRGRFKAARWDGRYRSLAKKYL